MTLCFFVCTLSFIIRSLVRARAASAHLPTPPPPTTASSCCCSSLMPSPRPPPDDNASGQRLASAQPELWDHLPRLGGVRVSGIRQYGRLLVLVPRGGSIYKQGRARAHRGGGSLTAASSWPRRARACMTPCGVAAHHPCCWLLGSSCLGLRFCVCLSVWPTPCREFSMRQRGTARQASICCCCCCPASPLD